MISLDPRSPNYYEKKIKNKCLLKIFRFFQLLFAFGVLFVEAVLLGLLYCPNRCLKSIGRRGCIVRGHKGFSEIRLKGSFQKQKVDPHYPWRYR